MRTIFYMQFEVNLLFDIKISFINKYENTTKKKTFFSE